MFEVPVAPRCRPIQGRRGTPRATRAMARGVAHRTFISPLIFGPAGSPKSQEHAPWPASQLAQRSLPPCRPQSLAHIALSSLAAARLALTADAPAPAGRRRPFHFDLRPLRAPALRPPAAASPAQRRSALRPSGRPAPGGQAPSREPTAAAQVCRALTATTAAIPGARVENNKFCLSVHFRCVQEQKWCALEEQVRSVLKEYPDLLLTRGRKVLEIRPSIKWDKGNALQFLLEALGFADSKNVFPIYIGDDRTHEDAFKWVRSLDLHQFLKKIEV